MGKSKASRWRWRLVALVCLLALVGAGWIWWRARHWTPSRKEFPVQGVEIGASDGAVDFQALKAIGVDFVYIDASSGGTGRDPRFSTDLREAARSGLRYGVVHQYDPCVPAGQQAANFVTIVPRDAAMLPPAISLSKLATACHDPIAEAGVQSELTTFLNQIEANTGQPAVLKISRKFEDRYRIARDFQRNLWLTGSFLEPDYAGRPFTLWTANAHLLTAASDQPLRWIVVRR